MDVVVDAHIVGWYYQSYVRGKETDCSGSVSDLFDRLGRGDTAYLDDSGKVEAEWRRKADPEWFDAWIAAQMTAGNVVLTSISNCPDLIRKLRNSAGFPKSGTDKWYVCLARSRVLKTNEKVGLVSEDIDFFEPKAKNESKKRAKHLSQGSGKVAKLLRKVDVDPRTVARHLRLCEDG